MPRSEARHNRQPPAGEINLSAAEKAHLRARLAFEASCQEFDEAIGIENAWQNLDNWYDSPRYAGGLYGGHNIADEQNKAVAKMIKTFGKLRAACERLDEPTRDQLFETTICFSSNNGKSDTKFEFNLPQIIQGEEANGQIQNFKFDQADPWNEQTKQKYAQTVWEYEALYQNSILSAAEFIFGPERKVPLDSREETDDKQKAAVWQRMDQVGQGLSDMLLAALNNGPQKAALAIYRWMYNFNASLLNPTLEPVKGKYLIDTSMNRGHRIASLPGKYNFQFAFYFLARHLANWDNNAQQIMSYRNSMWG